MGSPAAYCNPDQSPDECCGSDASKYNVKCPFIDCCNRAPGKPYCSPISGNGYETRSKSYYFDCKACDHGNSGAGCYPDFPYASPRSGRCHTYEQHDDSADAFY